MSAFPYLLFATMIAVIVLWSAIPVDDPDMNDRGGSAYCIERKQREWRARPCERFDTGTGDATIRRLMGLPTCWWTASADDFVRIAGVGNGTALGLEKYRDLGGQPTVEQLSSVYRLGESKSSDIVEQVTTNCARITQTR